MRTPHSVQTRYWFEFDLESQNAPAGVRLGCGVTAYSYDDALNLISEQLFSGRDMPAITRVIEDVDVSTLDAGHVLPNMELPKRRGIWFPRGYR